MKNLNEAMSLDPVLAGQIATLIQTTVDEALERERARFQPQAKRQVESVNLNSLMEDALREIQSSRTIPTSRVGRLMNQLRDRRLNASESDKPLLFVMEFSLLFCCTDTVSDMGKGEMPDLMSASQAAKFCGISAKTLYAKRAMGDFPRPLYVGDKSPRYRRDELTEWLNKCPRRAKKAKTKYESDRPKKEDDNAPKK